MNCLCIHGVRATLYLHNLLSICYKLKQGTNSVSSVMSQIAVFLGISQEYHLNHYIKVEIEISIN